jgi:hypothetical protein
MAKAPEGRYRAWDKRTNKMKNVLSVDFEKGYAILKGAPQEKVSISDIVLLKHMGIASENRKGIYEDDIVSFKYEDELKVGLVTKEKNGEWFFEIAQEDKKVAPRQLKGINVLGNKFENSRLLSEEYLRLFNISEIEEILSSDRICDEAYCKHDLEKAISKLSELTREELIDLIKSLSETLRHYKKAYFEESLRNSRR